MFMVCHDMTFQFWLIWLKKKTKIRAKNHLNVKKKQSKKDIICQDSNNKQLFVNRQILIWYVDNPQIYFCYVSHHFFFSNIKKKYKSNSPLMIQVISQSCVWIAYSIRLSLYLMNKGGINCLCLCLFVINGKEMYLHETKLNLKSKNNYYTASHQLLK